jgi:hypothetical protein
MPSASTAESFQRLMDVTSDVPPLLEEVGTIFAGLKIPSSELISNLLQNLLCTLQKLDKWQESCRRSASKTPYWAVPARMHNPSDDAFSNSLFPFALEYESLDVAMPMVLNYGVMLQILAAILQLDPFLGSSSDPAKNFYGIEAPESNGNNSHTNNKYTSIAAIRVEANNLARLICQSMEYFLRDDMGTLGPHSTCYTQWVAKCYFGQVGLGRELEWCKNIKNMSGPGSWCGIELMLFGTEEEKLEWDG